jgi:hypothetical protein
VDKAVNVNPDTHLNLTFSSTPILGKSGQIHIYDAANNRLGLSVTTLTPDHRHQVASSEHLCLPTLRCIL